MPRYAAVYHGRNDKHVLLVDIINMTTGYYCRDHCWVRGIKLFKLAHCGDMVTFKARERKYKKRIPSTINGMSCLRIVPQIELIKISDVEIVRTVNYG